MVSESPHSPDVVISGSNGLDDRDLLEKILPPGPRTLVVNWHYIIGPPLISSFLVGSFGRFVNLHIPFWVTLLACLLSYPIPHLAFSAWTDFRVQRTAAALCANIPILAKKSMVDGPVVYEEAYPRDLIFKLAIKYGPSFMMRPYNLFRVFVTTEPEHIKAILATSFVDFEKGSLFREQMKSLLGSGVFNADDELWKFHRSMTRPFFSRDRISHFDIFDRHASNAIEQMKARAKEGYAVDWQDLVSRFTLDSATEFLFGKDVRSLSTGLPYPPTSDVGRTARSGPSADEFASAFWKAQHAAANRGRFANGWGIMEFWDDRVEAQRGAIDRFINPIIDEALRRKTKGSTSEITEKPSEEDTLLSHLLKVTDDPKIIHDETINILLAGRDTTASALTFAVYRLAEHPSVLRRLREEILSTVGSTRRPTYEDIRNMKYLRAVINETLRLYPPVPGNIRTAIRDVVLPDVNNKERGLFIPAGMRCIFFVFNMHRRKDLWGPDALSFDPDRFLDERLHKYLTPNPFIFLPFNAGPRICLGQQLAYNEMSFTLVRLLQQVTAMEFTPEVAPDSMIPPGYNDSPGSDGTDRVWIGNHLTAFVKGGLWLKITEAGNE